MARGATVSADLLQLLLRHPDRAGALPEGRVPAATFLELFDRRAAESQDRDFGLHLGESAPLLDSGHVLMAVAKNSPTLGAAVERFFKYHPILADAVQPEVRAEAGLAWLTLGPGGGARRGGRRHSSECALALLASLLRGLSGGRVGPRRARFTHPRPADTAEHQRLFRCPLAFDQGDDALAYAPEDLAQPVSWASEELLATLERFAQGLLARLGAGDSSRDRVAEGIARRLAAGHPPLIAELARPLGIGPRQLQNRLRREGTSFQRVLDAVRKELALEHLRGEELSLGELAFALGFSEQSAFNRAFKRWTGRTPGEVRRREG